MKAEGGRRKAEGGRRKAEGGRMKDEGWPSSLIPHPSSLIPYPLSLIPYPTPSALRRRTIPATPTPVRVNPMAARAAKAPMPRYTLLLVVWMSARSESSIPGSIQR